MLTGLGQAEDGSLLPERPRQLSALQDNLDAFERGRKRGTPPIEASAETPPPA